MAFFALVLEAGEPAFSVRDCHINLWSLRGIGRSVLFLDVGILFRSSEPVSVLHVAIPFGTDDHSLTDLSRHILTPSTAELIFGNPITFDIASSVLDYGSGPARVQFISTNDAARIAPRSGSNHSYWTLPVPPTAPNDNVYVRFRFNISSVSREWTHRRSLLWHESLLIDFRVADVREASGVTGWETLKSQIVPIQQLYVFVVLPAPLHLQASSPALRYTRLLESEAWRSYLSRRAGRFSRPKFLVYYWRQPPVGEVALVNEVRPFRGFLSLRRNETITPNTVSFWALLLVGILGVLWLADPLSNGLLSVVSEITPRHLWVGLGVAAGVVASGAVLTYLGAVRLILRLGRAALRAVDRFWYDV